MHESPEQPTPDEKLKDTAKEFARMLKLMLLDMDYEDLLEEIQKQLLGDEELRTQATQGSLQDRHAVIHTLFERIQASIE